MTINGPFFHPAWAFLALALALPFLRGTWWRCLLLVPPLIAIWAVVHMQEGSYGVLPYLGQEMVLGRVDRLSKLFANVFAIQALIGMIYALHLRDRAQHAAASVYVAGSFGCVFAGDYLTLFIFWEMMSVSSAFLVWLNRKPISIRAGLRYFLFHTLGGLLILAGLLLRYRAVGSLAFISISPENARFFDWLILTGFCVNAAAVPLHAWLPDTYPEATVTGAVFMCAFTTKTAVYALARGFAGFEVLTVAGTVMAVYGVLYAAIENDARRILSYHIVSQVGYMLAGIGIGTAMTINGAVVHAYAHILYKGLLFMGAGCLLFAAGTARLDQLGGLVRRMPWVMIFYMVGALSISGVPFFNGFVTKNMTIHGTVAAHREWIGFMLEVAAVGTFVSVGLKLPYFAFWAKPDSKIELKPIPANMYVAMAIAAGLCLAMGVYPQMVYRILPHPVFYAPFEAYKVLQAVLLLGFTGLGFFFMHTVIKPLPARNLDFDILYRFVGNAFVAGFTRPLAAVDDIWTQVYRRVGLAALMGSARGAGVFDRRAIDTAVDGTASTVHGLSRFFLRIQTGRLQDYLAWMTVAAMVVFTLVWWLADWG
ncbi:MAG: Na(+)/H(+) antiporter subunit D [Desulfobacterales bacterium]